MSNRTWNIDAADTLKKVVRLYVTINVTEDATPVPTLRKWNYPTFGIGPTARTYTAATSAVALPSGNPYPVQYQSGTEGAFSIARTAVGLYTLTLQDNYQRLVDLNAYAAVAGGTPVFAKVTENTTITNLNTTAGLGIVGLAFWDFAAAAVDPIGVVRLALTLADATEP